MEPERSVQVQFMRPRQLEVALRNFPVCYVPFGLIEWHGLHLPLGNDALKAHAILVRTAEKFGGVVYPPVYFPTAEFKGDELQDFDRRVSVPLLEKLFDGLKRTGVRVIIGVTGHDIKHQVLMIQEALKSVTADGTVAGDGFVEAELSWCPDSDMDHAAKWETSNMMWVYPELVNMKELGDGPLAPDMAPPDGIGGLDPRIHASAEVGRKNIELASDSFGLKARELLGSLAPEYRRFSLPEIRPRHWWQIY
jgi:creatinine amidohydrolase